MEQNYQKSQAHENGQLKIGQLIKFTAGGPYVFWSVNADGLHNGFNLVECELEPGQLGLVLKELPHGFLVLFGEHRVNISLEFLEAL